MRIQTAQPSHLPAIAIVICSFASAESAGAIRVPNSLTAGPVMTIRHEAAHVDWSVSTSSHAERDVESPRALAITLCCFSINRALQNSLAACQQRRDKTCAG
ncbi:hypothetical protein ZHAS_00005934 [Anopheles sinensis]|uniref:Uncharacterized protein n=1 Tax=Anopheles sinensis TaxID=74873 RepID=A0A084VKN1_ANOSI|nr:hypothetical protein ZHAS_00005934 [Anopheles sinensis]